MWNYHASRLCVVDAYNDIKHWRSVLNLICADEDEQVSENLASVTEYLGFAAVTLEALLREDEKES